MMLLVKMEDYSLFPSLCMEDPFQIIDSYDNGLYGRKKKKKESLDVAECRLDSPCNSPEVSGGVDDGTKRWPKLLHSDSFTDASDSADYGSTFSGVDMEGFCEISATMTASEDIMLSSSAKESKVLMKEDASRHDLSKLTVEGVHGASRNDSSANDSTVLQSEFERDVDVLLDNCLWRNRDMRLSTLSHDLLPDLSGLAVSGYLLSDIPSHPDLSCDADESVNSLLTYCTDKEDCAATHTEHKKEELLSDIKSEEDICPQNPREEAVCSDFDALCTSTLTDDTQSYLSDCPRLSSCQCSGDDCPCYKSDVSSTEDEDVCIEYIISQHQAKQRRAKRRPTHVVRRGPGRPRKLQNVDFVRRGPGRPRKKSTSDAVVWYHTRRKRTVSLSNGCKSRKRQKSLSDDKDAPSADKRKHIADSAADRIVTSKRSNRCEPEVPLSAGQLNNARRLHSYESSETDEEDVVDVVSIGDEFQELYGVSTIAELVQHINSMHSYHTQRFVSRHSSNMDSASAQKSASKFSINLSMSAKSTPSHWSDSWSDGRRRKLTNEQRTKREALNDLERRRRNALARELSALRDVVPEMKEGFRAAKVVILAAAENHIHLLERKLRRDQSILKVERERHASLKSRLLALSAGSCT